MAGYDIEFLGERLEPRHQSGYVKRTDVSTTDDPYKVVAKRDIVFQEKKQLLQKQALRYRKLIIISLLAVFAYAFIYFNLSSS